MFKDIFWICSSGGITIHSIFWLACRREFAEIYDIFLNIPSRAIKQKIKFRAPVRSGVERGIYIPRLSRNNTVIAETLKHRQLEYK